MRKKFNQYEGEEELDSIIKKVDEEINFFLEILPQPSTPSYPVHPDPQISIKASRFKPGIDKSI